MLKPFNSFGQGIMDLYCTGGVTRCQADLAVAVALFFAIGVADDFFKSFGLRAPCFIFEYLYLGDLAFAELGL